MTNRLHRRITLKDGRTLGFAEFGDPQGIAVAYFHGFPASRLEAQFFHVAATRACARIIAIDRPGYGLSDFQPQRRITDWPDDVAQLMDALEVPRFVVIGVSGGGPYALACAWKIPDRLAAAGVVCGLGPVYRRWARAQMTWPARLGFTLAIRAPSMLKLLYGGPAVRLLRRRPKFLQRLLSVSAPPADRAVLKRSKVQDLLFDSSREALRQGADGALRDFVLYAHDWGFQLDAIDFPVVLWHGTADKLVPPSHSKYQSECLPRGRLHLVPGEGHFSLFINYPEKFLTALANPC